MKKLTLDELALEFPAIDLETVKAAKGGTEDCNKWLIQMGLPPEDDPSTRCPAGPSGPGTDGGGTTTGGTGTGSGNTQAGEVYGGAVRSGNISGLPSGHYSNEGGGAFSYTPGIGANIRYYIHAQRFGIL